MRVKWIKIQAPFYSGNVDDWETLKPPFLIFVSGFPSVVDILGNISPVGDLPSVRGLISVERRSRCLMCRGCLGVDDVIHEGCSGTLIVVIARSGFIAELGRVPTLRR